MEDRFSAFTGLILNISRCIQKIKNTEMSELGLKGKQVQCLFSLYSQKDGASLTELCEACEQDKGAMSRTVKELSLQDLVFVDKSGTQKYKNPIKLTAKGKRYAKVVVEKISCMLELGSKGLSQKNREILYQSLECVLDNLTQICKEEEHD